jgi:hypothetical protein
MAARTGSYEYRLHHGRGGPRIGAGRPPLSKDPPVHHIGRPPVPRHCPSHVTLRVRPEIPPLRDRGFLDELRPSLELVSGRGDFRILHCRVRAKQIDLIVEAAGKQALGRGMKAVSARVARAVHRAFDRTGAVLYGRYRLRILETPAEVQEALASLSAPAEPEADSHDLARGHEVSRPRTSLLRAGWRRHGRAGPGEAPGR